MIPTRNFLRELHLRLRIATITKYCKTGELDKLIDQQSMEPDQEKRKQLVWQIDKQIGRRDVVRPILYHMRQGDLPGARSSKASNLQVNSIYNGWRHGRRVARNDDRGGRVSADDQRIR